MEDIGEVDIFGIDFLMPLSVRAPSNIKGAPLSQYLVLEQACHKPAAQLLAEADDPVFGSRVDFEIEALGSNDIVHQLLAVVLDIGLDLLLQGRVLDEGLDGEDMVAADFLNRNLDLFEDLVLGGFVAGGGRDGLEFLVDLEETEPRRIVLDRSDRRGVPPGHCDARRYRLTNRLVVPVTFFPVLRAEQTTTTLLETRLALIAGPVSNSGRTKGGA